MKPTRNTMLTIAALTMAAAGAHSMAYPYQVPDEKPEIDLHKARAKHEERIAAAQAKRDRRAEKRRKQP